MTLKEFLTKHKLGEPKRFEPCTIVDVDNRAVEIILEDTSYYTEWIKGEGATIAIFRSMEDNRVIGARLPLRTWNGKFRLFVDGEEFSAAGSC